MFVSFFGPDGAGKSTHAKILAKYLRAHGFRVRIVWIRAYHSFAYLLSRVFKNLSPHSVALNPHGNVIRICVMKSGSINRLLWAWIEFASILPWVILRVHLPLLMGRVVIAERFLIDSIVSVSYTLDEESFASTLVGSLMLRLIPKNSVLMYLDSGYDTIKKRRGIIADQKEYIEFQRSVYSKLSKSLGVLEINTSQVSIEETTELIRDCLLSAGYNV